MRFVCQALENYDLAFLQWTFKNGSCLNTANIALHEKRNCPLFLENKAAHSKCTLQKQFCLINLISVVNLYTLKVSMLKRVFGLQNFSLALINQTIFRIKVENFIADWSWLKRKPLYFSACLKIFLSNPIGFKILKSFKRSISEVCLTTGLSIS